MIKHVFKFFLALVLTINLQAQVLLSENFNNGFPLAWQSIDADGLTPVPQVAYCGYAFATHIDFDSTSANDSILVATSWFTPVGAANNYLITPQITLLANGNFLTWQAKSQDPSYPDGYMVLVSTTNNSISSFTDTIYNTNAEVPYWINRQINLDAYAGQSIYLAFRHYTNNKFILAIDNIEVYADITFAVNENYQENNINVYPNPTNGMLYLGIKNQEIIKNNSSLTIYDISGKEVFKQNFNNAINNPNNPILLNLNALQNGIYFLHAETKNGSVNKKIIVAK